MDSPNNYTVIAIPLFGGRSNPLIYRLLRSCLTRNDVWLSVIASGMKWSEAIYMKLTIDRLPHPSVDGFAMTVFFL